MIGTVIKIKIIEGSPETDPRMGVFVSKNSKGKRDVISIQWGKDSLFRIVRFYLVNLGGEILDSFFSQCSKTYSR